MPEEGKSQSPSESRGNQSVILALVSSLAGWSQSPSESRGNQSHWIEQRLRKS